MVFCFCFSSSLLLADLKAHLFKSRKMTLRFQTNGAWSLTEVLVLPPHMCLYESLGAVFITKYSKIK